MQESQADLIPDELFWKLRSMEAIQIEKDYDISDVMVKNTEKVKQKAKVISPRTKNPMPCRKCGVMCSYGNRSKHEKVCDGVMKVQLDGKGQAAVKV